MSEVALLIQEIKDMEYGKGSTDHDRKNPTDLERNACLVLAYKLGWVVQGRRNSEIAALAVKKISIVNGYTCSFVTDPIECIRRWADDDKLQLTLGSPDAGKPGPKSMLDIHDNLTIMRHYRAAVNEITDEASWDDFVEQMNKQGLADQSLKSTGGLGATVGSLRQWFKNNKGTFNARTSKPSLTPANMKDRFDFCMSYLLMLVMYPLLICYTLSDNIKIKLYLDEKWFCKNMCNRCVVFFNLTSLSSLTTHPPPTRPHAQI